MAVQTKQFHVLMKENTLNIDIIKLQKCSRFSLHYTSYWL